VLKAVSFALQFADFGYSVQFFYSLNIISFQNESINGNKVFM